MKTSPTAFHTLGEDHTLGVEMRQTYTCYGFVIIVRDQRIWTVVA